MSHPFRWYAIGVMGRRASVIVALAAGMMLVGSSYGQGKEAIDVVVSAGERLADTNKENLLAIITVCALILVGYFGWIEKTSLQVIQQKVTSIENALIYSGILKKRDEKEKDE